jgi:hypothetical protein
MHMTGTFPGPEWHKTSARRSRAAAAFGCISLPAMLLRRSDDALTRVVLKVLMCVLMCQVLFKVRCEVLFCARPAAGFKNCGRVS